VDEFDPGLAWRRSASVALRPEPFGALVYSFRNRKLSFLKSPQLVDVAEPQRPAYATALADPPAGDAGSPYSRPRRLVLRATPPDLRGAEMTLGPPAVRDAPGSDYCRAVGRSVPGRAWTSSRGVG
jgi:putative mycofactocin binding protein MftB